MFQLGDTASITCSTPIPVQSIQWVTESTNEMSTRNNVQELELTSFVITTESHNTRYTCTVSDGGFMETVAITIEVAGGINLSLASYFREDCFKSLQMKTLLVFLMWPVQCPLRPLSPLAGLSL